MEVIQLRDRAGRRKYLNPAERKAFYQATKGLEPDRRALCLMLYYTGCRISETLSIVKGQIDFTEKVVVIRTLKQRNKEVYRTIPIPDKYLAELRKCFGLSSTLDPNERLWTFSRSTAYRVVKAVMSAIDIEGIHACPKGLRHGFGIAHAIAGTPPNLIQRWMGHASLRTTMIYLEAVDNEARAFAKRVW